MMISILIPTRENYENIERCLSSFFNLSFNSTNFEILLGMDLDDTETILKTERLIESNKWESVRIIKTDRMYYNNFHKYMYNLYENSKGSLLWLLADDVEIKSQNWDNIIINEYNKKKFFYGYISIIGHECWTFSLVPIIQKKWVDVTGRVSENSQTDLWLGHIAEDLGIIHKINDVEVIIFQDADQSQHNSHQFYTVHKNEWNCDKNKIKDYISEINFNNI